jgi:hypothetical protein
MALRCGSLPLLVLLCAFIAGRQLRLATRQANVSIHITMLLLLLCKLLSNTIPSACLLLQCLPASLLAWPYLLQLYLNAALRLVELLARSCCCALSMLLSSDVVCAFGCCSSSRGLSRAGLEALPAAIIILQYAAKMAMSV